MGILGKEVSELLRNPEVRNAIHEVLDAVAKGAEHPEKEVTLRSGSGEITTVSVTESRLLHDPVAA